MKPSLIVHGGAWNIPDAEVEACQAGCRRALEAGWQILRRGGPALDAVEATIVVLEDDTTFDAGTGSHLNRDGRVQLDAIVMDGATLRAGAVAAVERIRNPIRLARRVLESCEHMMLVGAGAEQFAAEQGLSLCDAAQLIIERERERWQAHQQQERCPFCAAGTVGAVAHDAAGNLVSGTSTGGTCCKLPGRVGDSPLIGCGCYADIEAGGVSCTGHGEAIMKIVMAHTACELLRAGVPPASAKSGSPENLPQAVAQACVRMLAARTGGTGGLILLDRNGTPGFAFNTPRMAYGYVAPDGSFVISTEDH